MRVTPRESSHNIMRESWPAPFRAPSGGQEGASTGFRGIGRRKTKWRRQTDHQRYRGAQSPRNVREYRDNGFNPRVELFRSVSHTRWGDRSKGRVLAIRTAPKEYEGSPSTESSPSAILSLCTILSVPGNCIRNASLSEPS